MQTVLTIAIVFAAAGYLAWVWAPRKKAAVTQGAAGSCGTCGGCTGCANG